MSPVHLNDMEISKAKLPHCFGDINLCEAVVIRTVSPDAVTQTWHRKYQPSLPTSEPLCRPASWAESVQTSRARVSSSSTFYLLEAPSWEVSQQQALHAAILTLPRKPRGFPLQQQSGSLFRGKVPLHPGGGEPGWGSSPSVPLWERAPPRWSRVSTQELSPPWPRKLTWTPLREIGKGPRVRLIIRGQEEL